MAAPRECPTKATPEPGWAFSVLLTAVRIVDAVLCKSGNEYQSESKLMRRGNDAHRACSVKNPL